jgi:hypothetical protein
MCSASVQVISESLQTTIDDIKMLRKYPSNSSEYVHPINMTVLPIAIMCTTIGESFFSLFYKNFLRLYSTQINSLYIMFTCE